MKRIAIITHSLNTGGAERIAGLLSVFLSDRYDVFLFLMDCTNIVYEYKGTLVSIGNTDYPYEYEILQNKMKYNIDISISFLHGYNFANLRTRINDKIIISERNTQESMQKIVSINRRIKKYYSYADCIVACSEGVKQSLINTYDIKPESIRCIYNFINKNEIIRLASENIKTEIESFLDGSPFFVAVGRLHPQKNHRRIINQFHKFKNGDTNKVKLIIIGSGELRNELMLQINKLELNEWVRVFPYMTNPFSCLARSTALIVASKAEGLPNVMLEAMVIGKPIIATDCLSGPRELLDDNCDYFHPEKGMRLCKRGILVSNDMMEDDCTSSFLCEAMDYCISHKETTDKMVLQQYEYMKNYSMDSILKQWIQVIETTEKKSYDILKDDRKLLYKAKYIYIYGHGEIAKKTFNQMNNKFKIHAFIAEDENQHEDIVKGIPVVDISEVLNHAAESVVVIGAGARSTDRAINALESLGYYNIIHPC